MGPFWVQKEQKKKKTNKQKKKQETHNAFCVVKIENDLNQVGVGQKHVSKVGSYICQI